MIKAACAGFVVLASLSLSFASAVAQPPDLGCTSSPSSNATQTLRCDNGITIVAESGARFELKDNNRDGHIDSIELSSKALFIEVPRKPGGARFKVLTPQAIAAVRGTKWAVDASDGKTAVFVADGRVAVSRRGGGKSVTLGVGEGVDVEGPGALVVKRWGAPRVAALMARLGQ
ncbi:FecR family protein [Bradyrhizobium liaoningense]|uniref:FecR family protein n=1 Tax=Bradyrhizobium liaoningense TaxID=43992 RepID=UPI001BA64D12|nr:FecR family protein [Bradyrhizobium liaoningense]MBR0715189.1 FecR domain-containing protein [Bradyrhizobium liaoningense]